MVGGGEFGGVPEACRALIREAESVTPGADAAYYAKAHRVYAELYPALKPVYAAIAALE